MAQPFQQSSIVIPVHPRECGQFHFCTVFPALTVYYLRFVKTIDALRHRVVIRVACAPVDASNPASLSRCVGQRYILRTFITVMDRAGRSTGP